MKQCLNCNKCYCSNKRCEFYKKTNHDKINEKTIKILQKQFSLIN